MRERNAVSAILLAVVMLFSIIGGENNMRTQAASETDDLDDWVLADTANDPADTLECVWDSEEHGLVLKKTEHFTEATTGPNASAIDKVFKEIGIEGNTKYQLSFDIKGEGSDPHYLVHAFFYDAGCETILSSQWNLVSDTSIPETESWRHVTCDVTSPENAERIQIRIQSYGKTDGDAIYVDNIELQKYVLEQPEYEILPIENGYNGKVGVWYGYNGSTGTALDEGIVSIVEEGCNGDTGALHINHKNACGYDLYVKLVLPTALPAGAYTISANTKGNSNGQAFYVACKSGSGNDQVVFEDTKGCVTSEWKNFSGTVNIPAGYSEVYVGVSQWQETADLYIDNIKLINQSDNKDYFADYGSFSKKIEAKEVVDETDILGGLGSFESIYDVFTTGTSGNVNKDDVTDIRDLVHIKRYLDKNITKADMAEDSDLTGDHLVKQDDVNALRQILLAEPQYRLLTIADSYPGTDAWYFITPGKGTAEIVEDGRDKGALHFVKTMDGAGGTETVLGFDLSGAETGDYTLTLYAKGSVTGGAEISFYQSENNQVKPFSVGLNAEWIEYSQTLHITKTEGQSTLFRINFGGYVGVSDLLVDNITLTDSNGKDVLCGKGTFSAVVTTP